MEVAVAAIAVITICCGRSVCQTDSAFSSRSKLQSGRELDEMRDYLEYMMLEEQISKTGHRYRR